MSTHAKSSLKMQRKLMILSYFYRYSASKLAKVTDHSKYSTQFDIYINRKMARNHGIINLIRLPALSRKIPQ